jgi:5'-nucleotidase
VILAEKSKNIDLIIGGHTHTLLEDPVRIRNSDGNEVVVAQVGWAGIRLGKIIYTFEKKSGKKRAQGSTIKISTKSSNK